MKTFKTLICAVALTASFVTSKADFVITASGTAELQTVTSFSGKKQSTPPAMSFNNKFIYTLISNAVLDVAAWAHTNIALTNLPADGYIVFNPNKSDGEVTGVFYVTNKSGFYYQLSGFDGNHEYYSWIELDSADESGYAGAGFRFGWADPFAGVAAYNLNSKTATGPQTETSPAVFYVHDDPYCYDDADTPYNFWSNTGQGGGDDYVGFNPNAIEVRGLLTVTLPTVEGAANISSLSITGSGNFGYTGGLIADPIIGLDKTGTVKFVK